MDSKGDDTTTSSNNSSNVSNNNPSSIQKKKKLRPSSSRAVAFGRTYFHALGGTTPAIVVPKTKSTTTATATATTATTDVVVTNDDDEIIANSSTIASKTKLPLQQQQQQKEEEDDEKSTSKQTTTKQKKNHTLMCYQWKYPPWMKQKVSSSTTTTSNNDHDDDDETMINHDDPNAVIRQAVATSQSTLFVTNAGKVYQTGTLHGHIYTSSSSSSTSSTPAGSPTLITIAMPIKCVEIAAGRHFCLARMQDGLAVLSWGAGHFGQLGVQTPVVVSSDSSSDDDDDDENPNPNSKAEKRQQQQQQITFTSRPILIEGLLPRAVGSPIQQIAAGDWHGMALTESGRVFCWGSNRSQQCGRKPPKSGGGTNGNSNPAPTILTPAPVPFAAEAAATTTSTSTSTFTPSVASDWVRIAKIAGGRSHSVALTRDTGQVYCWGSTLYGQCGNFVRRTPVVPPRRVEGLQDLSMIAIAAAGCHTLALTSGGRVFAWGQCHEGQLGVVMPNITPPNINNSNNYNNEDAYSGTTAAITVTAAAPRPRLVADLDFVAIAAGQEWKSQQKLQQRRVDIEEANTLTNNTANKIGDDTNIFAAAADTVNHDHKVESSLSPPPPETVNNTAAATTDSLLTSPLSTIPRITQIYAGAFYSVVVSSSGHVYTFGSNDAGQLGVPTPRDLPFRETGQPHKSSIAYASSSSTTSSTTVAAVTPSTVRELHVQSFDSRHLILLPVRVEAAMSINVRTVACGPNHLWCIGEERDDSDCSANVIGRTQYEVQEGHRRQTLLRSRAHRQQQQQQQQQPPNGFASDGVMLVPTTESKLPPPTRNHKGEEAAGAAKATATSSSLHSLEVRPSPLVDFVSPNDLPSPATTSTTVAADGLLTPSTDGRGVEADEESATLSSSSPVVGSALASTTMTSTTTNNIATMSAASGQISAHKNAASSSLPPSSPNRNVKRTRSRGIIRRLSSGIRKRLIGQIGGGKTKAQEEGGQLPLDTESERGHHHRRSRNYQNNSNNIHATTAAEGSEGGAAAPAEGGATRTRWRKRNTIG
jgi:alpha-tubulin suppressor-like RCC1 family protein